MGIDQLEISQKLKGYVYLLSCNMHKYTKDLEDWLSEPLNAT